MVALVENFRRDLKDFCRIARHSGKTDFRYAAIIDACAALINSK